MKSDKATYWQKIIMTINENTPFIPLEVYLFAKANGYDIIEKTWFDGIEFARKYQGIYTVYRLRRKAIPYLSCYILVNGNVIRFTKDDENMEIDACFWK
ncbi:hypothetical protein IJG14_04065 [bacterium]|nr:hypothetical protein [bacterium]